MPVTARQLESFMLEYSGRFNSRDYDKFERMKLMESPVRDAIHELKTYSLETLVHRFDVRLLGRGKRVCEVRHQRRQLALLFLACMLDSSATLCGVSAFYITMPLIRQ